MSRPRTPCCEDWSRNPSSSRSRVTQASTMVDIPEIAKPPKRVWSPSRPVWISQEIGKNAKRENEETVSQVLRAFVCCRSFPRFRVSTFSRFCALLNSCFRSVRFFAGAFRGSHVLPFLSRGGIFQGRKHLRWRVGSGFLCAFCAIESD